MEHDDSTEDYALKETNVLRMTSDELHEASVQSLKMLHLEFDRIKRQL